MDTTPREQLLLAAINGGLNELIDTASRLLRCPLLLGDTLLNVLAWAGGPGGEGLSWEGYISAGWAPDFLTTPQGGPGPRALPYGFSATPIPNRKRGGWATLVDLDLGRGISAHLVLSGLEAPQPPETDALIATLCLAIRGLLRADQDAPFRTISIEQFLLQLIRGEEMDEPLLRFRAKLVGLEPEGEFALLLVDLRGYRPVHASISTICARLRESETPEAFCRAISAREEQDAQEPPSAPSDAAPGAAKPGYQLLAVTACPTGIAHTYLAAEALQQAAQARGLTLKVETNGAAGVNDELTDDEIQAAECVIVAVDRSIPLARFVGKRLVYASAGDAVRDADRLLEKAVSGKAPVYRGGHAFRTSDWKELGREYYGHLMSGISHMLPFVVAGGVMLALSLLLQHLFGRSNITTMMTNVGNAAFRMMYPVLAAFIAYSIADRPGFMPGLMGGYLAQLGTTTAPRLGWISSGFWGAIVAGFAAGLAVRLLNYLFRRIPQELDHIKTGLLVPLLSLLFVGALMVMAINPPLGRFNAWLSIQLDGMQGGSRLVLGTLLGGMMATDYGGPINKAAYVSGTLALVDQQYDLMAAVMAGGMIPPLGIGLACLLFPTRFTSTERCSAPQTLLMGATFVTEGALPFALRDPLRVSLACIAGSALAGFITILLGCGCPAPHGGLFLLPVMENPPGFLIALAVGTLTTALLLGMLKKPLKH